MVHRVCNIAIPHEPVASHKEHAGARRSPFNGKDARGTSCSLGDDIDDMHAEDGDNVGNSVQGVFWRVGELEIEPFCAKYVLERKTDPKSV